ncbi:putative mitochondrial chaperone BCS1-B [Lachnellula suecica]|uniref:Putative mitochondrial chaperone BCS1-B n=1 Tax=Lachnellula suecica TaxID=602035 RepID=A0A8T9BWF9_9HELO|nr:putative mitochondrial chaperone BCS1-B [Lachnellula suecica]
MSHATRLLGLARTSLLGLAPGASIKDVLENSTPGFGFLQEFFASWLKIDLTTLATALTIFGTISSALQDLKGIGIKIYWWFTALFTASISVASNDKLNREIINWIGTQVLTRQGTRILTAKTEAVQSDSWFSPRPNDESNEFHFDKRVPIQYLPTFGSTWFIHERTIFMIRRVSTNPNAGRAPDEYSAAPNGNEPLVIMCLGRSVERIKRFLDSCRDFAEKQRQSFTTVRASNDQYHRECWDTRILRPIRPLETVHFDEKTKEALVADVTNYLDPATRQFYMERGIPYRRGYLLHGTPGTGKSSLSLALAGAFGLEMYLLHLPSIRDDNELQKLFVALPPRCIVLLEDIDAVGIDQRADMDEEEDEDEKDNMNINRKTSQCTLSGLLNVLDGVSSQEGRIVVMTSNRANQLDKALVRPGRIDSKIFLGNISQRSAELMFMRMYTPGATYTTASGVRTELDEEELQKLALDFSGKIPDKLFTPAELQGYLLNHRVSPSMAAAQTTPWVDEQKATMAEEKLRAKKAAEKRAKRRKEAAIDKFAKTVWAADLAVEKADVNGVADEGAVEATEINGVEEGSKKTEKTQDTVGAE